MICVVCAYGSSNDAQISPALRHCTFCLVLDLVSFAPTDQYPPASRSVIAAGAFDDFAVIFGVADYECKVRSAVLPKIYLDSGQSLLVERCIQQNI